ncbi:hypothetical protein FRC18_011423 [Serendipita sp. 400]|nr:hypothetical protein FRC18_011423 [Serendipita sp. 400]
MSLILNKAQPKKEKVEKQCPFFSRTGTCNRGKSCRYQHDSEKVAICPRFLSGDCPSTAETCLLSHSATLNRVSPCVHFQNNGRCKNGDQCVYPHVRVGNKASVCRDFAVLGYCEKGIDCNEAHLRECPDFAETGSCKNPKCKLPHVIRANRRKVLTTGNNPPGKPDEQPSAVKIEPVVPSSHDENTDSPQHQSNDVEYTFEGGDEFIPLTFVESEEEGDEVASEADEDEDEEEGDEEEEEAETEMKVFA